MGPEQSKKIRVDLSDDSEGSRRKLSHGTLGFINIRDPWEAEINTGKFNFSGLEYTADEIEGKTYDENYHPNIMPDYEISVIMFEHTLNPDYPAMDCTAGS